MIPRLTNPSSFGGDPADSFTIVAPSLPGYGLSFSPGQPRFGVEEIADCFASLMTDVLGYRRYSAQGGDWGSFITSRLAYSYPDHLIGIHLNMMPLRRDPKMVADPTSEEQKYLEQLTTWLKDGTGYQWIQGTRPQTLAFALTDSPLGLAAWIIEKFRAWKMIAMRTAISKREFNECGGSEPRDVHDPSLRVKLHSRRIPTSSTPLLRR